MSFLRRYLKKISFTGKLYRFGKKRISKLKHSANKLFVPKLTKERLKAQFQEIGLQQGDKIIINSSMSKLGVLENGPKTFVDALKEYITEEGLIVMSTYPHTNSFHYLENYEVFDVNTTPSKNGALTEYFRKSKDVTRSIHPTHPLAAWGRDSRELMEGHEKSTSLYDLHSPYKKLLDLNIKIVLIGVNFNHAVMIRVIDDLYPDYPLSPYIPNKTYHVKVKGYNGELIEMITPCHDPAFSKERYNMAIFPFMKDKIKFARIGKAETWIFSSQELFNTQIDCAKKNIFPFYKLPLKNR
jgi:aminoglycoside 3-N-acetyltransferase